MKKAIALFLSAVLFLSLMAALPGCGKDADSEEPAEAPADAPDAAPDEESGVKTVAAGPDDPVAMVRNGKWKYGYINTSGEWVIAPQYVGGTAFYDGVAIVCTEENPKRPVVIDKTGAVVATFSEDVNILGNTSGTEESVYDFYPMGQDCRFIYDGMIRITNDEGKIGFANTEGKVAVPAQYEKVLDFSEGLAAVRFDTDSANCWGYIDKEGNTVIGPSYSTARSFNEGLAAVEWTNDSADQPGSDGGYIDKTGKLVIHGQGKLDLNKAWIWDGIVYPKSNFSGGVAFVWYSIAGEENGYNASKYTLAALDKSGNPTWVGDPTQFTSGGIICDSLFGDGLMCAQQADGTFCFVGTDGKILDVAMPFYSAYMPFSEGLCAVREKDTGVYWYIDKTGAMVGSKGFEKAYPFINGYGYVQDEDGSEYYIDKTGAAAVQFSPDGGVISAGMPFTK